MMSVTVSRNVQRFGALLAGASLSLAFAPFEIWPIATISILVFYYTIYQEKSLREVWFRGFLFGIGKYIVGASWILSSMLDYSDTDVFVCGLLFSILVLILAMLYSLVALFAQNFQNWILNAAVFASGCCLLEICLSFSIGFSFPFLHLGYAFIDTPLSSYAPVGGVWLVSYLAVFSSVSLLSLAHKKYIPGIATVVIWLSGFVMSGDSWTTENSTHEVALVQGNVAIKEKFKPDATEKIVQKYVRLTRNVDSVDLVIWPETAIPGSFQRVKAELQKLKAETGTPLILGAFERTGLEPHTNTYNSAVAINGGVTSYRKQQLVPVGEYTPDLWPVRSMLQQLDFPESSLTRGNSRMNLMRLGNLNPVITICYEIAYPDMINRYLSEADFIVSISEDSWFGDTHGAWQQLQIARMRARETGRYVLRVSNDGPTAFIRPNGEIGEALPRFVTKVLTATMIGTTGVTPFVQFGLLPVAILILISLLSATYKIVHSART